MILKLIQFIFLIVIVYVLVSFIRIIFSIGKSAGEINRITSYNVCYTKLLRPYTGFYQVQ